MASVLGPTHALHVSESIVVPSVKRNIWQLLTCEAVEAGRRYFELWRNNAIYVFVALCRYNLGPSANEMYLRVLGCVRITSVLGIVTDVQLMGKRTLKVSTSVLYCTVSAGAAERDVGNQGRV